MESSLSLVKWQSLAVVQHIIATNLKTSFVVEIRHFQKENNLSRRAFRVRQQNMISVFLKCFVCILQGGIMSSTTFGHLFCP